MKSAVKKYQKIKNCSYCEAPLDPDFYFCKVCSKPYKHMESVISPQLSVHKSAETLVKEKAPGAYNVFWVYFSVILTLGVFSLAFADNQSSYFIVNDVIFIGITVILSFIYWSYLKEQMSNFGFNKMTAYIGLLLLLPCLLLNVTLTEFFNFLNNSESKSFLDEFDMDYAVAVIAICVIPGIFEEIGFRGILQSQLLTAVSVKKAICISAFLFALVHFNILNLPYLFVLGVLLGWVSWKTKSVYPSILIHFLHNFVVITYF